MLLEETIQLAREAGYIGICITGEPKYYPKRGFFTCDKLNGFVRWQWKYYNILSKVYPMSRTSSFLFSKNLDTKF